MRGCTGCAAAPGTTTEAAIARRAVLRVRQIVRAMATADVSRHVQTYVQNGAFARLKVPVFKRTPACSPAGAVPELPWCFFLLIT